MVQSRLSSDKYPRIVPSQPEVSGLSLELVQRVTHLARSLVAAARNWTLYPPEHPASRASFERLAHAIHQATKDEVCSMGITPDTLLVDGVPIPASQPVAQAARLLHDRDLLQVTFSGGVPADAVASLLGLLSMDSETLREHGGPSAVWSKTGHESIALEQVDYGHVLEDKDELYARDHDDIWTSIVHSIASGQNTLNELAVERLLTIARDPRQIAQLATAVMAAKCAPDGSPMITTQAATVLAAFRHLAATVSVKSADRSDETMRNLAAAAVDLNPHVVLQMMQAEDDAADTVPLMRALRAAFDDAKLAQVLAAALAADGQASPKLAEVFDTIAPDPERKRRVLTMARTMLSESAFGQTDKFKPIWKSMEELLLSYNDKRSIPETYRTQLDGAGGRSEEAARKDVPEEMPEWLESLGQQNVRKLSVLLVTDLLKLERDQARAGEIANDLTALAEDLLMSGDYRDARDVAAALDEAAGNRTFVARAACREALTSLGDSLAMHETVAMLSDVEKDHLPFFAETCLLSGPPVVGTLGKTLTIAERTPARRRAADIIVSFGARAIPALAPHADDPRTFVLCNLCDILGRIGAPEGVPLLQPLLRKNDPRLTRAAISALATINDPSAARAIHTVLRSATGDQRGAVIDALLAGRDARVVPMLVRILQESQPLGKDHSIVLDTLGALKVVHTDAAVRPIDEVMRRRRWFARRKNRALKRAAVDALASIGTDASKEALARAAQDGDRVLRKAAKAKILEAGS
jgi:hypothetical protein